jgi:hypothetical protein
MIRIQFNTICRNLAEGCSPINPSVFIAVYRRAIFVILSLFMLTSCSGKIMGKDLYETSPCACNKRQEIVRNG